MQRLTSEEIKLIEVRIPKRKSGSRAAVFLREIGTLAIGEGLLFIREEWPLKSRPTASLNAVRRYGGLPYSKYKCQVTADDTRFIVSRVA